MSCLDDLIYCPNGHHMTRMALPDLQRRSDSSYRAGFICNACSKGTSMILYHCDICSYDLCRSCGMTAIGRNQCELGHPLVRFTKDDLLAYDKRSPSRRCVHCNKESSFPFMMMCPSCYYNVCPECYKKTVLEPKLSTPEPPRSSLVQPHEDYAPVMK